MKRTLFNGRSDNVVGYCHYHNCYLTVKQMKCRECLSKQCNRFERNESHPYWEQRRIIKEKRKARKENINNYVEMIQGMREIV